MNDVTLLTIVGIDRKNFDRFGPLFKDYVFSKECLDVYKAIGDYYKSYPSATKVNWEEFSTFFFLIKKIKDPEKNTSYRSIIRNCSDTETSVAGKPVEELPKFFQDVLKHYVKLDYVTQIANTALRAGQSLVNGEDATLDEVEKLLESAKKEVGHTAAPESIFVPRNLSALLTTVSSKGLEWPLEELNVSAGPVRKGDFIIVSAYVETGKTTFSAHCVSHFLRQLTATDGPIIWINNEEQSPKVMFRIIQSYFGVTTEELIKNAAKYEADFESAVGSRLLIPTDDSGYNSVPKLNALFKEYKPSVIVFDQLDKVNGWGQEDRDDIRLGKLYGWAREKARENGVVIAVSQADATGASTEWLTAAQLRGSKVDKPGEADAIITIGKSADLTKYAVRYIHLPKNKLLGGPRTRPEFRHGHFEVEINAAVARYRGKMKP